MTDALEEVVPEVEETEVRDIVQLVGASLLRTLKQVSRGERVFMVISAPSGRRGNIQLATDLHDDELNAFLHHVLKHVNSVAIKRVKVDGAEYNQ